MSALCSETVAAYNADREDVLRHRRHVYNQLKVLFGFAILIVLLVGVAIYRQWSSYFVAIDVVVVGLGGLFWLYRIMRGKADAPTRALQADMRDTVFPGIFHEIEGLRYRAKARGFVDELPHTIHPVQSVGRTFASHREKPCYAWGDLIEGRYQGLRIAVGEVKATQRVRGSKYSTIETVFEGITLRFDLAQDVPSLSVSQNAGVLEKVSSLFDTSKPLLERIKTVGSRPLSLEQDVECDDPDFARRVFGEAGGMRRYCMLQSTHAQGDMRLAVRGRTAYLTLETTKDFMELPPLEKPLDPVADVRRLRGEMSGLLELIADLREMLEFETVPERAARSA